MSRIVTVWGDDRGKGCVRPTADAWRGRLRLRVDWLWLVATYVSGVWVDRDSPVRRGTPRSDLLAPSTRFSGKSCASRVLAGIDGGETPNGEGPGRGNEMSTQTSTADRTVRLGVAARPFGLLVGVFAALGFSLGLAGFLIGYSGHGQLARQPLMSLMLGLVPFLGVVGVSLLGPFVAREVGARGSAPLTVAAGGVVGHLLVFALVFGFLFVLPWDPDMNELHVIDVMLRGTASTAVAGALVGLLGERLMGP